MNKTAFASLMVFSALVIGVSTRASARSIHVTTTADASLPGECSLRDAIVASNTDLAVAGCPAGTKHDVIQLQQGALYELLQGALVIGPGGPPTRNSLRIQGHGSTLDGQGRDRVISSEWTSLDLHDLTITGGNGWTSGGGLIARGRLTGRDVRVVSNRAVFGGGMYLVGPIEADLNGWTISDNSVGFCCGIGDGGGIYMNIGGSASSLRLRHCEIERNVADNNGGGIYWRTRDSGNDSLDVSDSTISENSAADLGGGLYVRASGDALTLDIRQSTIAGNEAGAARDRSTRDIGGGFYLLGQGSFSARIDQSTIADNLAPSGGGGAAFGPGLTLDIQRSTVSGNTAEPFAAQTGIGGGLLNVDSNMTLTDVIVTGNSASGDPQFLQGIGGGILTVADGSFGGVATLSLVDTEIFGNDAGLADGVANAKFHPSFTAETTFRGSTICEEADTCASEFFGMSTTMTSLGDNTESSDMCHFTSLSDEINALCGAKSFATQPAESKFQHLRLRRGSTPHRGSGTRREAAGSAAGGLGFLGFDDSEEPDLALLGIDLELPVAR
jgi:CSLREA domain-containing protein